MFPLSGIKPPDSKLKFLSLRAPFDFYGLPLAGWLLNAANTLKVVFKFHSQVDVSCLLDSY